jgi:hypothetical protein
MHPRVPATVRGDCGASAPSPRRLALAGLIVGAAAFSPALAQRGGLGEPLPFLPVGNPLTANNAMVSDQFGEAISISGDIAVVGAWLEDNDRGLNAGSAYVYRWNGAEWIQIAKLIAPDGAADDRFGQAVAVYRDMIVVGSSLSDVNGNVNAGAAYVYRFQGSAWGFEAKLTAGDPAANDRFGLTVAASESGIAVGAPREERPGGLDQGAVYMYNRVDGLGWTQNAKLVAGKPGNNDWFGFSIDMEGTVLAVGAQNDDTPAGVDAGSVYVFNYVNAQWLPAQLVRAADGSTGANFGSAVAINGDLMVIGAERDSISGIGRTGSAYVFARSAANVWTQAAKVYSTVPAVDDFFGSAVGISGKTIVVGAEKANLNGINDSGSVQAFEFIDGSGQWVPGTAFNTGLNQGNEYFGADLAFANGLLLVAAPFVDLPGVPDAGAAFAFARDTDCNADGLGDVSQIALGELTDINGNGVPDICECIADWDNSGQVSSVDVGNFVNDWFIDQSNGSLNADINANGVTNTTDVSDFVNAYFEGCL